MKKKSYSIPYKYEEREKKKCQATYETKQFVRFFSPLSARLKYT